MLQAESSQASLGDAQDPWRAVCLDLATRSTALLALLWIIAFAFRVKEQELLFFQLEVAAPMLLPAVRRLGFGFRGWWFIAGFCNICFVAALLSGPAPGAIICGLLASVAAGLFFGVRQAVAVWILSGVLFGLGLHLTSYDLAPFYPGRLDPRSGENLARMVGTYLATSCVLTVGVAVVINRVDRALEEARQSEARALALMKSVEASQRAREQALEHFIEAQKFEVVARLSSGVAHDVNNSLQIVLACAECLEYEDCKEEDRPALLREIQETSRETAQMARQLLALGERPLLERKSIDVSAELNKMRSALSRTLESNVKLNLDCEPGCFIEADLVQLKQALLNLTINAGHSMAEGGQLRLSCRAQPPDQVTIQVKDTGVGMDEDLLQSIFTPFFTTKGQRGTGLGLPTVKAIVERHGGTIELESELGVGTRFTLCFPAAEEPGRLSPLAAAPEGSLRGKCVLVVDDDPRIRRAVGHMLKKAGALVESAAGGEEALALLDESKVHIDVLCADAIMPGLSCQALIEGALIRVPHLQVLICSAYFEDELLERGVAANAYSYLPKPFSGAELVRKVSRLTRNCPEAVAPVAAPQS